MRELLDAGIMESYAPLVENKGVMTAQFEHVSFPSPKSNFWTLLMFLDNIVAQWRQRSHQSRR